MKRKIIAGFLIVMFISLMSGCQSNNNEVLNSENSQILAGENKKIVIASKPHTEQYILAELMAQLIEAKSDIKVQKELGIAGGTANIHPAMVKGDVDIYAEYTNTGWLQVLKNPTFEGSDDELYTKLSEQYEETFGFKWLQMFGFNDSYSMAILKEYADANNINTYSDLGKFSKDLVIGANYDFYEIEGGYNDINKVYNFDFKSTKDLDVALKYAALENKQVDAINVYTTDGYLNKEVFKVLEDDKAFFPTYYAAPVIRKDTLEKYPEVADILNTLKITTEEMIEMNYKVEIDKQEESKVAKEFLEKKGLI